MDATRVAVLQFKPARGRPKLNRERLKGLVERAAAAGAELVVAPEMATSGYIFPERADIAPLAEERDGPSVSAFRAWAERLGVTLVVGWPEKAERDLLFNSAAVCFPDREPIFYRKNLLFEADRTWAEVGDTPYPMWRTRSGAAATLGICMDLNDLRFRHHLKLSKARLCCFPTNWLDQGATVWNYWAWCLSDTKACLLAANSYGTEDQTRFRGESAVLDRYVLLATAPFEGDRVLVADVPMEPTRFPRIVEQADSAR